jgi:hypothetical protein
MLSNETIFWMNILCVLFQRGSENPSPGIMFLNLVAAFIGLFFMYVENE